MKAIRMIGERREGKKWVQTYENNSEEHCTEMLTGHLFDRYIGKAPYIKRITDQYDYHTGMRTITVYDCYDYRTIYTAKR